MVLVEKRVDPCGAVRCEQYLKSGPFENALGHVADTRLVVDEQDHLTVSRRERGLIRSALRRIGDVDQRGQVNVEPCSLSRLAVDPHESAVALHDTEGGG